MATLHLIPTDIAQAYEVHEWRNAAGVLSTAHPAEWQDVIDLLRAFEFRRSEVLKGGGRKSVIAKRIDTFLEERGWKEKKFTTVGGAATSPAAGKLGRRRQSFRRIFVTARPSHSRSRSPKMLQSRYRSA